MLSPFSKLNTCPGQQSPNLELGTKRYEYLRPRIATPGQALGCADRGETAAEYHSNPTLRASDFDVPNEVTHSSQKAATQQRSKLRGTELRRCDTTINPLRFKCLVANSSSVTPFGTSFLILLDPIVVLPTQSFSALFSPNLALIHEA